jgi:hypothetical protein
MKRRASTTGRLRLTQLPSRKGLMRALKKEEGDCKEDRALSPQKASKR